ncbi:MAG: helix-turn-helix domain-containing protein [Chloroflexi bacterium]|nr:helix-turn-helix domain-containing protein [Chloroflexota bacterium]
MCREQEKWLSVAEAAEYLGVTPRAIRKYIQQGKLRAFKSPVGGRTLFRPDDLEAFRQPRPYDRRQEEAS